MPEPLDFAGFLGSARRDADQYSAIADTRLELLDPLLGNSPVRHGAHETAGDRNRSRGGDRGRNWSRQHQAEARQQGRNADGRDDRRNRADRSAHRTAKDAPTRFIGRTFRGFAGELGLRRAVRGERSRPRLVRHDQVDLRRVEAARECGVKRAFGVATVAKQPDHCVGSHEHQRRAGLFGNAIGQTRTRDRLNRIRA